MSDALESVSRYIPSDDEMYTVAVDKLQDLGYTFTDYEDVPSRLFGEDESGFESHFDPRSLVLFSPPALEAEKSYGCVDTEGQNELEFASQFLDHPFVRSGIGGRRYYVMVDFEEGVSEYPRGSPGLVEDADEVIRSLYVILGDSESGVEQLLQDALT